MYLVQSKPIFLIVADATYKVRNLIFLPTLEHNYYKKWYTSCKSFLKKSFWEWLSDKSVMLKTFEL